MASTAPSEVMNQIFILLPMSTVKECMFVCKSWYSTAVRVQYSSIALTDKNIGQFTYTLVKSNGIATLVKYLSLDFKTTPLDGDVSILMYYLSNLKTLVIQSLSDAGIMSCLERMYSTDYLKCIEEIRIKSDPCKEIKKLHFITAYVHRHTLTHLHLNYLQASYTMNDKSGNYLKFLPDFKNLTHLSIFNDLFTGDRYMVIYTVLELCPKLKSFMLQSIRYFPDASQPKLMELIDNDLKNNTVKKLKKLKSLIFDIHELDDIYMKYIILYTRVDSFKLIMTDMNFYDWLIDKQDIMNEFGYYLSQVKELDMKGITAATTVRGNNNRTTLNLTKYRVIKHWEFLNQVIMTRKDLNCHVYFSVSGYQDEQQKFELNITNNNLMTLTYTVIPEHSRNNNFISSLLSEPTSMIHSLELNDNAKRFTLDHSLEALSYAFKNCPQLQCVVFHRAQLCYRMESISPYTIHFDDIPIKSGQGKQYSQQERNKNDCPINHISIRHAELSRVLMQLLSTLPLTKVLLLKQCTLPDDMMIDLSGIQELHYLELDTTHMRITWIKIEMSQQQGRKSICYNISTGLPSTTTMELYQERQCFTVYCNTINTLAILNNPYDSQTKHILKPALDVI